MLYLPNFNYFQIQFLVSIHGFLRVVDYNKLAGLPLVIREASMLLLKSGIRGWYHFLGWFAEELFLVDLKLYNSWTGVLV